jgi:hypothetical protein
MSPASQKHGKQLSKRTVKVSGHASITYAEALDVALAWGWLDGQKGKFDEAWWLQKFTPRDSRSMWSKIHREKAIALVAAGKMMPSGQADVERARTPRAKKFFATLDSRNRYAVLFRVQHAQESRDGRPSHCPVRGDARERGDRGATACSTSPSTTATARRARTFASASTRSRPTTLSSNRARTSTSVPVWRTASGACARWWSMTASATTSSSTGR